MYKVLIVDDEEIIREGLALLVDWPSLGFEIGGYAGNGQEALKCICDTAQENLSALTPMQQVDPSLLSDAGYDLIVTDIRMPVLDGLEFIRKLRTMAPDIKIIIISGYNEFTYAQQAIALGVKGFLLKPIDRHDLTALLMAMKEELDESRTTRVRTSSTNDMLRNRFLYDLVHGNLTGDEITAGRQSGWIDVQSILYVSALLEIANIRKMVEESLEKAKAIRKGVMSIAMQIVGNHDCGAVYEDEDGLIGILFRHRETVATTPTISAVLREITDAIHTQLAIHVSAAFGEGVCKTDLLKKSRAQAGESLDHLMFTQGTDETAVGIYVPRQPVWDVKWSDSGLIQSMEDNNESAIKLEISTLLLEIAEKSSPVNLAHTMLYAILLDINRIIRQRNGSIETLVDQKQISSMKSLEEMNDYLTSLCLKVSRYYRELSSKAHPKLIDQIAAYIDAHYMEDITLKSVSQQFFMNTSYLGQIFKNATKESLNNYLNKCRITEAKRMILADNLKIYTIVDMIGYKNTQHFYKQFRKYEGLSVQEYKKQHSQTKPR